MKSIDFNNVQKLRAIPKKLFEKNGINFFTTPLNVESFENSWNKNNYNLKDVLISEGNHNFSYLDEEKKVLIIKSNLSSDEFDVLIFVIPDVEKNFIPSTIRYIKSFTFSNCSNLQVVEFSEDSKRETFEQNLFYFCSIKEIKIPSSVKHINLNCFFACTQLETVLICQNSQLRSISFFAFFDNMIESLFFPSDLELLEDFWQFNMLNLVNITISPDNKHFKHIDEERKIIVGKSKYSNEFDVIVFACHDIKSAFIPSSIKHISPKSFYRCLELEEKEFTIINNW